MSFSTCADFSKGRMFELCESYPRIIPANHTSESYPRIIPPKITIMNVSFGIVWDCIVLTSSNGPDKLIDQCWPNPMIPGYLHIPSRSGESSPRAQSLIILPKLAGSGWLAGWLGGWLSCCCWLGGWLEGWLRGWLAAWWVAAWLAAWCVADEADEEDDSGCGWLAGWQPNQNP